MEGNHAHLLKLPSVTTAGIPPTNILLVLKSLDPTAPFGIVPLISTYRIRKPQQRSTNPTKLTS